MRVAILNSWPNIPECAEAEWIKRALIACARLAPARLAGAAWRLVALITFGRPIPQCRKKRVAIDTKNWYILALARR